MSDLSCGPPEQRISLSVAVAVPDVGDRAEFLGGLMGRVNGRWRRRFFGVLSATVAASGLAGVAAPSAASAACVAGTASDARAAAVLAASCDEPVQVSDE